MKILVACANYPDNKGNKSLVYVHTRNLYYRSRGIDVSVINFSTGSDYIIDGINVYSLKSYEESLSKDKFSILISHAPNIRNHYRFLKKYEAKFDKLIFIFHGHEIVNINKVYPKPYFYKKKSIVKKVIQEIYDKLKLQLWKIYYTKISYKSHFVFVSESLLNEFFKWTKINKNKIKDKYSIINNSVSKVFEENYYDSKKEKKYDFITIRTNIDDSTYCIDMVNEIAKNNKEYKFLLVGKGDFFNYSDKSSNIEWINKHLNHNEILELINESKYALMPTKRDTQGVMSCEMATFGIPVITSNIPICREIFREFKNVIFIENTTNKIDIIEDLNTKYNLECTKNTMYFNFNTTEKEVELIKTLHSEIQRG